MKIKKKYGIVFWITGLSGSGKSNLGNIIFNEINKKYGKTIESIFLSVMAILFIFSYFALLLAG